MTATFIEHFSDLKDPRDDKNKKHQLMDIVFLVIAAVICAWQAQDLQQRSRIEFIFHTFWS